MPYIVQAQEHSSVAGHEPGDALDETRFGEEKIQKMLDSGAIVEGVATPKKRPGRPPKNSIEGEGTSEPEKTE